jgi:hypothetical protein
MIAVALLGFRACAYLAGWATGRTIQGAALLGRLLPVAPVPDLDPCPCICCGVRAALAATNRTETPWCDCPDYPPHQRCQCGPCLQVHQPVALVQP